MLIHTHKKSVKLIELEELRGVSFFAFYNNRRIKETAIVNACIKCVKVRVPSVIYRMHLQAEAGSV